MAIEYQDITQLEKLDALTDGSYVLVVQDGTAKLISKENAKFGGGSLTVFTVAGEADVKSLDNSQVAVLMSSAPSITLLHPDGTEVTPQEAYDAYMAGPVRISVPAAGSFADVVEMQWEDASCASADPTNIVRVTYMTMDVPIEVGGSNRK